MDSKFNKVCKLRIFLLFTVFVLGFSLDEEKKIHFNEKSNVSFASVSTTFNSSLPNNINIAQGLALSKAGLTQSQGGLTMTPGLTMSQGGLPMSQSGLTMSQGGLPMSQGALPMSQGGLPMSQSLSVSQANSLPLSQLGQYLSQNGSMVSKNERKEMKKRCKYWLI